MTNVISLLREAVDVPFSDVVPGLTIRLRRLTSLDFDIAHSRATKAQRSLGDGIKLAKDYGLENLMGFSSLPGLDLTDVDAMVGVMSLVAAVEIGMLAIESWVGLELENKLPAKINRPTIFKLLADEHVKKRFMEEVDKAASILRIEKKDLPASPSGTATDAATGSAPNTVPDAPN